ncbi:MAG: radical SAM protein [Methanobrevibacter sp.]|jgi:radical SAM superfamily enzyme YgiQ (UPF0313 family)|nr:radical SAM protein [Candidatus Methanovirga aequatorialis]
MLNSKFDKNITLKNTIPNRKVFSPLNKYARLVTNDKQLLTGNVETSRGCIHKCLHCPVYLSYNGSVEKVDKNIVIEDIKNLVKLGAEHITFVDADFLNLPHHSLDIIKEMNSLFPFLTFDFTSKISNFMPNKNILKEMVKCGLKFVVTAIEFNDNTILDSLNKCHDTEEIKNVLILFNELKICCKPTFVLFNPFANINQIIDTLLFIEANDLIMNVDPIQYKIRLLIFKNSPLSNKVRKVANIKKENTDVSYITWEHKDLNVEKLYNEICAFIDYGINNNFDEFTIFKNIKKIAFKYSDYLGQIAFNKNIHLNKVNCPKYNVPNFCCSEPTGKFI